MTSFFQFIFKQNVFFNVMFLGVMCYGLFFSIPNLPVDRYPNINFGEVVISTPYPGASSQDVERLVTEEIEESLKGMNHVEFIRSSSKAGYSSINVKFVDDTDYDALYDELRLRVLSTQNRLPSIRGKPLTPSFNVTRVDDWLPVLQVNLLSSNSDQPLNKRTLARLAEDLQFKLDQIPNVQEVKLNGKEEQQFNVVLEPTLLRKHRVQLNEVQTALAMAGGSTPGGVINGQQGEQVILIDDRFRTPKDLYDVVIRKDAQGTILTLLDLINPEKSKLQRMSGGVISSINGLDSVSCQIVKSPEGNAKDIKEAVLQACDEFLKVQSHLPIQIQITLDSTVKIDDGLGVLQNSLGMAMVLVMLAIFLFLSSANRSITWLVSVSSVVTLIVMVRFHDNTPLTLLALGLNTLLVFFTCQAAVLSVSGIAFSFVGCLVVFQLMGYSLNEITLLGFVLTSGIIVDDAIVVLENIQRHRDRGLNILNASVIGTQEVFWPVISASLTTIAAFLPMLIMTGSVGEFFALIPITVSTALAISLIECLSIMPIHAIELEHLSSRFGRWKRTPEQEYSKTSGGTPSLITLCTKIYDEALGWCLAHRFLSLCAVALLFFLAIGMLAQSAIGPSYGYPALLKLKFFPDDTSNMQIKLSMSSSTPLEGTDAHVRRISRHLLDRGKGYIKSVSANSGISIDSSYKPQFGSHLAFMIVELPAKADRAFTDAQRFIDEVRLDLESVFEKDGHQIEVSAQKDGPPVGAPLHARISGVSEENVVALGEDLYQFLYSNIEPQQTFEGLFDLKSDRQHFSQVLGFKTQQRKAAERGLNAQQIQFFTGTLFEGSYVGDLRMEDDDIPIMLKCNHSKDQSVQDLLSLPIVDRGDELLYFYDVGTWSSEQQPSSLERRDHQRIINITANIKESSLLQAQDFKRLISQWFETRRTSYPGASVVFGGEAESTNKSYQSLISAFLVTIFLIYGILAVQFKSYSQPLLIMANILFSFTGVILMTGVLGGLILILPDGTISQQRAMITVQSFIAILGLTGLVVNDAIVLIDFINQERAKGLSLDEAVRRGAHYRVRPIIMTTWSTIAGLLPLAIGIPSFSITWGPFATCFVAGLSMSTLMTLLIIPVLYHILESFKSRWITSEVVA